MYLDENSYHGPHDEIISCPQGTLRVSLLDKKTVSFPHCLMFQNQFLECYKAAMWKGEGENRISWSSAHTSNISVSLGQRTPHEPSPSVPPPSYRGSQARLLHTEERRPGGEPGALTLLSKCVQRIKRGNQVKIVTAVTWQGKQFSSG